MLFDIKRTKSINKNFTRCIEHVNKYHNQVRPEGMKFEEWEKVKLTPNKVLSYLKRVLKNQHRKEQDFIKLVKFNSGLKLKGYSQKNKIYLSKFTGLKEISFNEMILKDEYLFDDATFRKLLNKKIRAYKQQSIPFKDMQQDRNISEWLENYQLNDSVNHRVIKLNNIQREDMGKMLQKRYGLLQWDCGGGKSLAAIAYAQYHLQHKHIKNMFIVAPAIAITGTFESALTSYGIPFVKIDSLKV